MPFSLLPHASRTVLAVKGSLRRALRRALDGSGPFCKPFPSKREKGRSRTGTLQSNGLPLVGTARLHKGWKYPQPPIALWGWMPSQLRHGTQFCGEIFLLTSPFIEQLSNGWFRLFRFVLGSHVRNLFAISCFHNHHYRWVSSTVFSTQHRAEVGR